MGDMNVVKDAGARDYNDCAFRQSYLSLRKGPSKPTDKIFLVVQFWKLKSI